MKQTKSLGLVGLLIFSLFLVSGIPVNASEATVVITGNSLTLKQPGDVRNITLVASEFPDGLSGYRIRIEFDSSVVNITNVVFPSWATLHQIPEQGPGYIVIKAADLTKQVEAGATNVTLATLEVQALDYGTSPLNITIEQMDDDHGNPIEPTTQPIMVRVLPSEPPLANFTFSPEKPAVGQSVTFDASGSYDPDGSIVQYTWDFGDGTILNTTKPKTTHAYTSPGNYTITLTIKDNTGVTNSITKQIEVINHEPSVTLICEVVNETLGKVKCTATATDEDLQYKVDQITKYVWDFGDSNRAENETSNTTVTVEHTYTKGGNYIIKVTVFDKFNANASANTTISISPIKTKEISHNETHDFRKEIHVDYSSLPLNYTSGFQYVNETAFNYIKTFVIPNVTNTSNKYLDSLIKEYLANVIKEERETPSWEVIDIKKDITNDGWMDITINWTRTSEIIGYNKTSPSDRLRLVIKEERTIYVSFSFPPIREQNAPVINIMSPTETIYNITTIPIKVNITDESNVTNITAFLDGVKIKLLYNLTSGLYENTTIVFTNGSHVLKVYARDEYGNLNMTRVYFVAHEGLKVEQKGNVTVGILGNVTNNVTLVNNTVVANVSVNGTTVPVEVPVETTNNVLINVSAIEEVLSAGPGNASVVATWNASASKPKVIAGKNKLEVSMNLTMGQNTTMLIAIKLKYGVSVNVTLYKRNGTVYILTKDKNNEIGYYYIVDKVLFVALKKDPDELVISDKAPAQNVLVPSDLSYLMMLDYVYYHNFIKYNATYSELYKKVLGAGVDNETLQKAEKLHEMAVEEYKKAVSISGGVALNSSDPRVFIHLRKAYIYIREAVKLLVKIVPEE